MGIRERRAADGDDRAAEVANAVESSVVNGLLVQAHTATFENTHHHHAPWRPPRSAVIAAVVVLVVAAGWFLLEITAPTPPEPGEPVAQVGTATAVGGLEYALPEPLGPGAEYDGLLDTSDPGYHVPSDTRYVPVGQTTVSFLVKGNRSTPVQITDVKPDITQRRPPLAGTLLVYPPPGNEKTAIDLSAGLDDPRLIVRDPAKPDTRWFSEHRVELAKGENQQFSVTFFGKLASYSFRIVVDYIDGDGTAGRLTVSAEGGVPFQVTGKPVDGRYGTVFLPNFPAGGGWHPCGTLPTDVCVR